MVSGLKLKLVDKISQLEPEIDITFADERILLKDFVIESMKNHDKYVEVQRFQVRIIK